MSDLDIITDIGRMRVTMQSEFSKNEYERAHIITFFENIFEETQRDCSLYLDFEKIVNSLFAEYIKNFSKDFLLVDKIKINNMKCIDSSDDNGFIDVDEYVSNYIKSYYKAFAKIAKGCIYSAEVDEYLDKYLDIFKYVIFYENNCNLNNVAFRKSKFLQDLITSSAEFNYYNQNDYTQEYAQYSLMDPFACDTVLRVLKNIKWINQRCIKDELVSLKKEIFLRRAERAFNRFIYYKDKTYRLSLNRHNSKLLCCDFNNLSSIEEIKPVRLFEKIAAFIRNNYKEDIDEQKVSICIIGHTEKTNSDEESECVDLLNSLLEWYDLSSFKQPHQKLNLTFKNIINEYDWPDNNYLKKRENYFVCEIRNNIASFEIEYKNYTDKFSYSTNYLKTIVESNDMVFLLDCPWLVTENYNAKNASTLEYFCKDLMNKERRANIEKSDKENYFQDLKEDWIDSISSTTMRNINSQLNRIMATNTTNAGKIVRIFQSSLAKRIENTVAGEKVEKAIGKRKELYVFCSETEGLNYTSVSSYPLMRTENYEGKNMTIIKFSNYYDTVLKNEFYLFDNSVEFKIRLWSVIKYISIAYAYKELKCIIDDCFNGIQINCENYFEIYRDIIIDLKIDNNLKNVHIQLGFNDRFDRILSLLCNNSHNVNKERIKEKLHHAIFPIIHDLYYNVIFNNNTNFGDREIRTAFLMNTYSCVSNVSEMMFWHKYRMANIKNDFNDFNIILDDTIIDNIKDSDFKTDLFMDKRIYDSVLLSLEYNNKLSLGIKSMLYEFAYNYNKPYYYKELFNNILDSCFYFDCTESNLYKNANDAFREMLS